MSAALPSPLLVIEASSKLGSVAVVIDGKVAAGVDVAMGVSRDDGMFPAIQSAMTECGLAPSQLAGVACGAGPGSFTSLRIAASLAKGLAHGAGVRLFAVPSLLLASSGLAAGAYLLHSDALRGERFVLRVHVGADGSVVAVGAARRVAADDLRTIGEGAGLVAVGSSPGTALGDPIAWPAASAVSGLGDWTRFGPVDLERWEPEYGRLAEAQVVWEKSHGHALPAA